MASAAPQKRMVSSVFITLASPFTPTARVHSTPAAAYRRDTVVTRAPPAPADLPPPRDPCDPCDPQPAPPAAPAQVSVFPRSSGSHFRRFLCLSDVCGFCRKPVPLSEPAIEALNRTYHAACFRCRQCHAPLAAKIYYNKSGIPLCDDCYQASLEPCWACGDVIKDHVIRALERAYHPPCFVCATCRQPIGEQRFAQGEVGEVYCLRDYYRKYAPQCRVCGELIIPREDGTDSYTVECLGHSYHEDCYRCEVCSVLLSPEPNETGCHPLDGQILCKPCHESLIQSALH
uniref:LIM zinc-binding domain-containing protein n=1 Tax=Sinocyclocheilus anshuiensis TaxID=1608454 RepID=A0A671M461_9TELE